MKKSPVFAVTAMTLCLFLLGCGDGGPRLAKVAGKVNFKGAPLAGATVQFVSESGGLLSVGVTDSQGMFTLTTNGRPGAPIGKCQVAVSKAPPGMDSAVANPTPDDMRKMQMGAQTRDKSFVAPKSEIPMKYADPSTSQLVADVASSAASNQFEFNLVE